MSIKKKIKINVQYLQDLFKPAAVANKETGLRICGCTLLEEAVIG